MSTIFYPEILKKINLHDMLRFMQIEILYFTDPMCSWCYGFSTEIKKLFDEYKERIKIITIPGGLHPFEVKPTPDYYAEDILNHWRHVNQLTGKQFNFGFFQDNPGFIYDTAPACKAVVTMNEIAPESVLGYLVELQKSFYADGNIPTDVGTFMTAAEKIGLDSHKFREVYERIETDDALKQGFSFTRNLGINSYPTVLLRMDEKYHLLSIGYSPYNVLKANLEKYLLKVNKDSKPDCN